MKFNNSELWLSFFAVLLLTLVYVFVVISTGSVPAAGEFFGHSLGVAGFILMLMTETLYTLRKRSRSARWGRMSAWLKFHIFTGLVGPYMVLLHSSWKFNGLAGVVMLLTVIIVGSGFIGRYIYTAIPRTVDGAAIASFDLEEEIANSEAKLQHLISTRTSAVNALSQNLIAPNNTQHSTFFLIFGYVFYEWEQRWLWWKQKNNVDISLRPLISQLEKMFRQRRLLRRQVASLALTRQLLSVWHAVHVPIGVSLFTAAFVHIAAAIYYATLLR